MKDKIVQEVWAAGREYGAVHGKGGAVVRAHYRVAEQAALAQSVQRLHRRHRHAPSSLATRRLSTTSGLLKVCLHCQPKA